MSCEDTPKSAGSPTDILRYRMRDRAFEGFAQGFLVVLQLRFSDVFRRWCWTSNLLTT
jgi:hypothetical protein